MAHNYQLSSEFENAMQLKGFNTQMVVGASQMWTIN